MARSLAMVLSIVIAGWFDLGMGGSTLAQDAGRQVFPASAVIRGENIWLRVEPAEATDIVAILQRGDAVTVTAAATAADGDMFYPVQVDATAAVGWVRDLFIDPGSIVPLDVAPAPEAPVAVEDEASAEEPRERPARRNRDRNRDQDAAAEAPAAETPVAAEPAPAATPAAAPAEAPVAPVEEAPPPSPALASVSGVGAMTSNPFPLEPGRYRVIATVQVQASSSFSAMLLGPDGFSQLLFNETVDTPATWTAETPVRIQTGGEFTIEVTNTEDAWTIAFEPR